MEQRLPENVTRKQPAQPVTSWGEKGDIRTTLLWFFDVAWRRWPIVLLCVIAGLGIAVYQINKATPLFRSSSEIYVERQAPEALQSLGGMEGVAFGSRNFLQAQVSLIESSAVLRKAADRLKEEDKLAALGEATNLVGRLKAGVDASAGNDGLIDVWFESPDAEEAAAVANQVVNSYIDFQSETQKSTASEVLKILRNQKQKREKELDKALSDLVAFKREHEEIAIEDQKGQSIIVQRLSRLSEALGEAEFEMIKAKAQLQAVDKLPEDAPRSRILALVDDVAQGQMSPERKRVQEEIQHIQQTLEDLAPRTTEKHPSIQHLQSRLAELREKLPELKEKETRALIEAMRQRHLAAKTRYEQLKERYEQTREEALDVESSRTKLMQLETELENARRRVTLLDERIKDINIDQSSGGFSVHVLEPARVLDNPVWPNKTQMAGMGLFGGLIIGFGLVSLMEIMDQRLRTVEDVRATLDLPMVGSISEIRGKGGRAPSAQEVYWKNKSPIAETFRTIRTSVFFQLSESRSRSLVVTSPVAQEGKSTIVSNLALAMAQAGHRTLIVDADLRKPIQDQHFSLENERGLSEVLAGDCEAWQAIAAVQLGKGDNGQHERLSLDVLPSGQIPENPAELLNSERFPRLVEQLSSQYDCVIFDSSPVLPVADARLIGQVCSGALLVLQAEVSSRKPARSALEALTGMGTRMLGVVVNAVPRGPRGYGYYRYGQYYGYYGHPSENGGKSKKRKRRSRERSWSAGRATQHESSDVA